MSESAKSSFWTLDKIGREMQLLNKSITENTTEMKQLRLDVNKNSSKISEIEQKLKILEQSHSKKLDNNKIDQLQLENAIILKGFKYEHDQTITENLLHLAKIKGSINKTYRFKKPISEKSHKSSKYFQFISFVSFEDKLKIIRYVKENGNPTCELLDPNCPEENIEDEITIDHALTPINLNIKRQLLQLRKQLPPKFLHFKMRNGYFEFKCANEGKWTQINNLESFSEISAYCIKLSKKRDISTSPSDPQSSKQRCVRSVSSDGYQKRNFKHAI